MAWPAYVVLVVTGLWNITTFTWSAQSSAWKAVLVAKIVVVLLAGLARFLHQRATTKGQLALWGSVAGTASVAALAMGVSGGIRGRRDAEYMGETAAPPGCGSAGWEWV